uniref:Uncharacterized protein n=1 Tax=Arsenophonus endosymbiont of Trialeurodes vaporariorum TaxID=235567 RepID=A0A3B0MQB2_9GAMM
MMSEIMIFLFRVSMILFSAMGFIVAYLLLTKDVTFFFKFISVLAISCWVLSVAYFSYEMYFKHFLHSK